MTQQIGIINFDNKEMQLLRWDEDDFFSRFMMFFRMVFFPVGNLTNFQGSWDDHDGPQKDDDLKMHRLCWTCMNPKQKTEDRENKKTSLG